MTHVSRGGAGFGAGQNGELVRCGDVGLLLVELGDAVVRQAAPVGILDPESVAQRCAAVIFRLCAVIRQ